MLRTPSLYRLILPLLVTVIGLASSASFAADRLLVYTVNYPLQYFAQRIAGDYAQVVLPVPAGIDPAFWRPDAAAIAELQRADLILLNGADYAKWLSRVSLPRRKLVDTSAGFRDRFIETKQGVTHSHGREGAHSHAGTAFTTWLDFRQAVEQAKAVRDALTRRIPEQRETFADNFSALEHDLLDLDARLSAMVETAPEKRLLASHPVYQYLARRYSLKLSSVMWEPDTLPPESEWQALAKLRKRHPATWMLWEAPPTEDTRERLHRYGVHTTVFNPCANRPGEGDFLSVMAENIAGMTRVFQQ